MALCTISRLYSISGDFRCRSNSEAARGSYPHQHRPQRETPAKTSSTLKTHTQITAQQSLIPPTPDRLPAKMATSSTPLLHSPASDATTESQSTISTHSLSQKHWFRRLTSRRNVVPFFLTLLGTLTIILAVTLLTSMDRPKPKNLIFMVSDGMGPASLSLARSYLQYVEDVDFHKQLPLDPYIVGTSRTRSHGLPPLYPVAMTLLLRYSVC